MSSSMGVWQEARRHEKRIRGIMVDFKKRAERRRNYYAKRLQDPLQLLRIYGQKCRLHFEESSLISGESYMMKWQGDQEVQIDRFDARAFLDYIDPTLPENQLILPDAQEKQANYERYRTLVQVEAAGASEEQYLKQLVAEEMYDKKQAENNSGARHRPPPKAAIRYDYTDSGALNPPNQSDDDSGDDDSDTESELSDIDITINIGELNGNQKSQLDNLASQFGIEQGLYAQQLLAEKQESEFAKRLEQEIAERSKMPGRKSKQLRRILRMKQKAERAIPSLPGSHGVQLQPVVPRTEQSDESDHSSSRSVTPLDEGRVEYITEFGAAAGTRPDRDRPASHPASRSMSRSVDLYCAFPVPFSRHFGVLMASSPHTSGSMGLSNDPLRPVTAAAGALVETASAGGYLTLTFLLALMEL